MAYNVIDFLTESIKERYIEHSPSCMSSFAPMFQLAAPELCLSPGCTIVIAENTTGAQAALRLLPLTFAAQGLVMIVSASK